MTARWFAIRIVALVLGLSSGASAVEPEEGRTISFADREAREAAYDQLNWERYETAWREIVEHEAGVTGPGYHERVKARHTSTWAGDVGEQYATIAPGALAALDADGADALWVDNRPYQSAVIHRIGITDEHLRELRTVTGLRYLFFIGLPLSAEQVSYLGGMKDLRRIVLRDCGVTLPALLAGLGDKPNLRQLTLIEHDPRLTRRMNPYIRLGHQPAEWPQQGRPIPVITLATIKKLAECFPKLEELDLPSHWTFAPDAIEAITALPRLKRFGLLNAETLYPETQEGQERQQGIRAAASK